MSIRRMCACKRSAAAFLAAFALAAPAAFSVSAADVTLTSANNSGYTWGTAGETLNVTLDSSDKFAGTLTITAGTAKFASNYQANTFGSGASIVLGEGATLDFNGMYLTPASITTTGAATITSSQANALNGLAQISMGGNLTLNAPVRYCLKSSVNAGGYEIFKTGTNEVVVQNGMTNLKALHINSGIWSFEANVSGIEDIYLNSSATLKVWGHGRNVTFDTMYHDGGLVNFYTDGGAGVINTNGNVVLNVDNARFRVSCTSSFKGDLSGEGKTLVHSALITPGVNGKDPNGQKDTSEQVGKWTFLGNSAEDKGTTTLGNFQLTTRDSEIILGDYAEWNISGSVQGQAAGHKFTVGANASLTAGAVTGMKTLTINGASDIGTLTMNQADGVLTIGTDTEVDSLTFSQTTALAANANLSVTGTSSIAEGAAVTKTGAGTLTLEGKLSGTGTLLISEGTLAQSRTASALNSFGGTITIGANGTLEMNGRAVSGNSVVCMNGAVVSNTYESGNEVYWGGLSLDIQAGAEVTLTGTKRVAFSLKDGTANGGTLNIANTNYVYLASSVQNAVLNVTGVLGIENASTLSASEGNDVYLNLAGGRLTSWTGTNTYTIHTTETTVKDGTISPNGFLILNGEVTLEGGMTLSHGQFSTNGKSYRSSFTFGDAVTGNQKVTVNGAGRTYFNAGADIKELNLTNGAVYAAGGTFQADAFLIGKTYSSETLDGIVYESGLIVDGGTLLSETSFVNDGKTVLMRGETSAMKLGGTVTDSAASVYQIDGGTLTLGDGISMNGKIFLAEDAILEVGLDSTKPAEVKLLSNASELNGQILFDIFSGTEFDQLILADGTNLNDLDIVLNAPASFETAQGIQLISGVFENFGGSILTPGWVPALRADGLYAYSAASVPEPASWLLFSLAALGLGWTCRRNRNEKSGI